jgi:hypothetical protein
LGEEVDSEVYVCETKSCGTREQEEGGDRMKKGKQVLYRADEL